MLLEELGASWTRLGLVVLSGVGTYLAVIVLTRPAGVPRGAGRAEVRR